MFNTSLSAGMIQTFIYDTKFKNLAKAAVEMLGVLDVGILCTDVAHSCSHATRRQSKLLEQSSDINWQQAQTVRPALVLSCYDTRCGFGLFPSTLIGVTIFSCICHRPISNTTFKTMT